MLKRRLFNLFLTYNNYLSMTLVYRTPKQLPIKPSHQLGPGSYNLCPKNNTKNKTSTKSCVFASSSTRDPFDIKKHKKETQQASKSKAKKKQSDHIEQTNTETQDGSSVVKPKKFIDCSHVFNSKVQRFSQPKEHQPQQINQIILAEQFKKLLMKEMTTHAKGKLLKAKDKLQKQKQLDDDYQVFPSIPNWDSSFGYRYDSETNKWVCNENPNLMEMMLEKDNANQKANHALGPGCYVYIPKKENLKDKSHQQKESYKPTDLMGSFTCPTLKPQTPIHNSIEQIQHKKKLRIRLLGKSQINKAQQLFSNSQNSLLAQDHNLEGKNAKQVLLLNQMYKKFKNYIPRNQQKQPSKYIEKIKQKKQSQQNKPAQSLKLNDISNTYQHFLARSQRFDFDKKQTQKQPLKQSEASQQTADQTFNTSLLENPTLIHKSHNCKEAYSLGQDRFKQMKRKQNLGPGMYNYENMQSSKLPPCLNLKEERFHHKKKRSDLPGPGQYDISQELLKKQNYLSDAFSYYKNMNNGEIRKHFKRQDSMQALYQTWGRQMNYMVKMQHQSRPQDHEETGTKYNENSNHEQSLTKAKKQLQTSLKKFNTLSDNTQTKQHKAFTNQRIVSTVEVRSSSLKAQSRSPSKIYPKITKHLYGYKQLPQNDKPQMMGPGKYETRKDMVKKTFNVTYT